MIDNFKDIVGDVFGDFLMKFLNKDPINVLMLAPSGIGKTSILAGLYKEAVKAKIGDFNLYADDKTERKLNEKLEALKSEISAKEVKVKKKLEATSNDEVYKFYLAQRRDDDERIDIVFTDIRGEDVKEKASKLREKLKDTDVIIVPIDAAALVEKEIETGKSFNSEINAIEHMETLFREFREMDKKEQLIIFVPVKSEKYFLESENKKNEKDNELKKLYSEFEKEYKDIIQHASLEGKTLLYMPVKTMGEVKFREIKLENNEPIFIFKPINANSKYSPQFLEMVFRLIILYTLTKKYKSKNSTFIKKIGSMFGGIDEEKLKEEREKYLQEIQKFNEKEKLIASIYGGDYIFGKI